jgi:hypothetical protein
VDRDGCQGSARRADSAIYIGPPVDRLEAERIEWVPLDEVRRLIDKRDIVTGTTLVRLAVRDAIESERQSGGSAGREGIPQS